MERLEDKLIEAACVGDRESLENLLKENINVNTRQKLNGWTPLHWACKKEYKEIVKVLIQNGADINILNNENETAADVCPNSTILDILRNGENLTNVNYLHLNHKYLSNFKRNSVQTDPGRPRILHSKISNMPTTMLPTVQDDEIVLKIRICGSSDPDFIEIEIPKWKLTYKNLLKICCEELQCSEDQVERIRKLPSTRLRNDNDVRRLENSQALELVMQGPPGSDKPTNCYQSISTCKDQTILY